MVNIDVKKAGIFVAGLLFGTVGIKVLSSKDAKKVYVHCTAAALRVKESVLDMVAVVQENAEDILSEAKQMNEESAAKEAETELDETTDG